MERVAWPVLQGQVKGKAAGPPTKQDNDQGVLAPSRILMFKDTDQILVNNKIKTLFRSAVQAMLPRLRQKPLNPSQICEEMRRQDRYVHTHMLCTASAYLE